MRLKINDALAVVVYDVDDVDVKPYACMDYTESITLVDQVSHVFDDSNAGDSHISGLNNAVWTTESDACLNELLVEGAYLFYALHPLILKCYSFSIPLFFF